MEFDGIFANRRLTEDFVYERLSKNAVLKKMPLKEQKKKKYRMVSQEYNFLQFVPMIRAWCQSNYGLTLGEFEMLLYLYPVSVFTSKEFREMMKEVGRNNPSMLNTLQKKGMIRIWSDEGREYIYTLSNKANELVTRMHRFCMLEEEIPMSPRRNKIVRSKSKTEKELTELFRTFNRKVREK